MFATWFAFRLSVACVSLNNCKRFDRYTECEVMYVSHFPNSVYCPLHNTMPKRAAAVAAAAVALAIGDHNDESVGIMNQCDGQCQGQQCQQIKTMAEKWEGERKTAAKCIDRSAILIYDTYTHTHIRTIHINSALSFHSLERSSMARVYIYAY